MSSTSPLFGPAVLALASGLLAQDPERPRPPLTAPEQSNWERTSTSTEVAGFLRQLPDLPHGNRLTVRPFGNSHEGKDLLLVRAARPQADESKLLRALIIANIHAGEVEGKEAVQMLLRELAYGDHQDLLHRAVLYFVPVYNPDGNDRIDPGNRRRQNGPAGGVGQRANAQGFDLNRDFVKAESPECRALLEVVQRVDPHLSMDLHTTNGSEHGYHLTYAPSLSPNVDPRIDRLARDVLLPEVRQLVGDDHGFRIFDYGNFSRRGEPTWRTYDHRPRFGINYFGLRNRFSVLSEAYSYYDFHSRVRATRAFVLEVLRSAVRHRDAVVAACTAADRALTEPRQPVYFGHDTTIGPAEHLEILRGENRREGQRTVATGKAEPIRMPVYRRFLARRQLRLPEAWAITAPSASTTATLRAHGIALQRLTEPTKVSADVFVPTQVTQSRRSFQGHREVTVRGDWRETVVELPAGTVVISARQPLGRLAAQLLEPESEDSLTTWNSFDDAIAGDGDKPSRHPVLRLEKSDALTLERITTGSGK